MSRRPGEVVRVAIVGATVAGVEAFHARCLGCAWVCHRQPHDSKAQAIRCARRHVSHTQSAPQVDNRDGRG